MAKGNIFQQSVEQREREQKNLEKTCAGEPLQAGKPARGRVRKSTTVLLDADKKIAIKKYAADRETNISDLFNEWIAEKCGEYLERNCPQERRVSTK